MEPKNKEERKKTFINFLLLFVACIAVLITMVFFSVRVPFSENDSMRKKMEVIDKEREFAALFTTQFINVSRMLDTINRTSPQEQVRLEGRVESAISKLDAMVSDTTYNKDLYINAVHNLGDLQLYLKEIRSKSDKDLDINSYKEQLDKANEKAQELYKKYIECLKQK
ncbi:MAG: type VI secretion system TssO [Ferruginibacter sp.]